MRLKTYMVIAIALTFFSSGAGAQTKTVMSKDAGKPLIGNIKNSSVVNGCGCYFGLPGEERKKSPKWIFMADSNEGSAWMNIDERDVKLRLAHATHPKGKQRVGTGLTRTYVAAGISVSVSYVATRVCKPGDEECESTDYDATFTVVKGSRKQTLKLKGGCGC